MRPDVSLFLPSLEGGGAERVAVSLANYFSERNLNVDIVLCQASGPFLEDLDGRVNIVDLKTVRVTRSFSSLRRYLRRQRPRVMLAFMTHANILAALALTGLPAVRLVVSERSVFSSAVSRLGWIQRKLYVCGVRWAYSRSDSVICISKGAALDLAQTAGLRLDDLTVINNPLASPGVVDVVRSRSSKESGARPEILAIGRLEPVKGFDTLIKAFDLISNRTDARLTILGEGRQRALLSQLIADRNLESRVELVGFVPDPSTYMLKSDLVVVASIHESFSNVLVEALAAGCRIVSTDCPYGPREILEDGSHGTLVPVGDVHALAEAILVQVTTPCDEVDLKARVHRAADFGVQVIGQKYLDVLRL